MTRFNFIYDSRDQGLVGLLDRFKQACNDRGLEFVAHDAIAVSLVNPPSFTSDDIVYRGATSTRSRTYGYITNSPHCTTFFHNWRSGCSPRGASYFIHKQLGLPAIPTFVGLPKDDTELDATIEYLGGFPLIIKARGGSLGVGVMRVDTRESFRSVAEYLRKRRGSYFVRRFIQHDSYVRAAVMGDKVIAAHRAYVVDGEFRTNAGDDTNQKRETYVPTPETEALIAQAVTSLGTDFGGVDLLLSDDGSVHIAEVNFPFDFWVTQKQTDVDICTAIVDFLHKKHQQKAEQR